jgi:hypothetical protein
VGWGAALPDRSAPADEPHPSESQTSPPPSQPTTAPPPGGTQPPSAAPPRRLPPRTAASHPSRALERRCSSLRGRRPSRQRSHPTRGSRAAHRDPRRGPQAAERTDRLGVHGRKLSRPGVPPASSSRFSSVCPVAQRQPPLLHLSYQGSTGSPAAAAARAWSRHRAKEVPQEEAEATGPEPQRAVPQLGPDHLPQVLRPQRVRSAGSPPERLGDEQQTQGRRQGVLLVGAVELAQERRAVGRRRAHRGLAADTADANACSARQKPYNAVRPCAPSAALVTAWSSKKPDAAAHITSTIARTSGEVSAGSSIDTVLTVSGERSPGYPTSCASSWNAVGSRCVSMSKDAPASSKESTRSQRDSAAWDWAPSCPRAAPPRGA